MANFTGIDTPAAQLLSAMPEAVAELLRQRAFSHIEFLTTPHTHDWAAAETLFWPWLIQFVMSWVGFSTYMVWDYNAYKAGKLDAIKLPSRHPVDVAPLRDPTPDDPRMSVWGIRMNAFWYAQLFMVPIVLFNQLVVWPLVSLLVVWPQWAQNHAYASEWSWSALIPTTMVLMLISDQMWYWSHRLMHVPWCWTNLHRMHHIAPQCAISATYVHPWEYTLFCISMQLPFAVAGYPMWVHAVPLAWGMLTGSGAHSGYGGAFANGEKHNAHHYYHTVNFGLLMIADAVFGTHWSPGDAPPKVWDRAVEIWNEFPVVQGQDAAGAFAMAGADGSSSGVGADPVKAKKQQ